MDQRVMCQLEIKKDDKLFTFSFPYSVGVGDLYSAAFEFLQKVQELAKDAVANASPKTTESVEIVNESSAPKAL